MPIVFGNRGYGGGSGRSSTMRIVIALVIAGVGLITYLSSGGKALSPTQEKALGLQAAPKMANEFGGAIDPASSREASHVAEIGQRLVASGDAAKSEYAGNFHFYLLADPKTINAFALPGGQIFITQALYDRLENDAQLAGVLGHEIGHVMHQHGSRQMAKGQLGAALATAVGVGTEDGSGRGQGAQAAAQMAAQMALLKYGRGDELEADQYGLDALPHLGYHPEQMIRVMEILKASSGPGGGPAFLQSHPDPDARIARIRQWISENPEIVQQKQLGGGDPLH